MVEPSTPANLFDCEQLPDPVARAVAEGRPVRVFISYAHDDGDHEAAVLVELEAIDDAAEAEVADAGLELAPRDAKALGLIGQALYRQGLFEQAAVAWQRLVETVRRVADKAEAVGQTVVIETHLLTILESPEANQRVISEVGSPRMKVVMDFVNHFPPVVLVPLLRTTNLIFTSCPSVGTGGSSAVSYTHLTLPTSDLV